jgi:hypothetical protein
MVAQINSDPGGRGELEKDYGKENVWDPEELSRDFVVHSFMAPFIFATRKSDGKEGTLMFQHHPRFYFGWVEK